MRKIWAFSWYQNLQKFEKNLKQSDRAPLINFYPMSRMDVMPLLLDCVLQVDNLRTCRWIASEHACFAVIPLHVQYAHLWCDLGESVGSRTCGFLIFLFYFNIEVLIRRGTFCWKPHLNAVVPKLWKDSQKNNRKQKKCIPFSGCISQSILPTSDWSC